MEHVVRHKVRLSAPVERVFSFYADPENVAKMTPPHLAVRLIEARKPMAKGSQVLFALRPRMIPFEVKWLLEVTVFEENRLFEERLVKGPIHHWVHRHEFKELGNGESEVRDSVVFDRAQGLVAAFAPPSFIRSQLEEAFRFREAVIRRELEPPQ